MSVLRLHFLFLRELWRHASTNMFSVLPTNLKKKYNPTLIYFFKTQNYQFWVLLFWIKEKDLWNFFKVVIFFVVLVPVLSAHLSERMLEEVLLISWWVMFELQWVTEAPVESWLLCVSFCYCMRVSRLNMLRALIVEILIRLTMRFRDFILKTVCKFNSMYTLWRFICNWTFYVHLKC